MPILALSFPTPFHPFHENSFSKKLSVSGIALVEGDAVSHYPSFEELVTDPRDPDHILVLTPAYRSFLSMMIFWIFTVVVVLMINVWSYRLNTAYPGSIVSGLPTRWLAVVPMLVLLEILRRKYNQAYIFGVDKATQIVGRLWFTYNETVIEYGDVRSINVVQSFWGRIFNFGRVDVSTAAQEDSELQLDGVISPEELAALVDHFRTYSRELDSHTERGRTND